MENEKSFSEDKACSTAPENLAGWAVERETTREDEEDWSSRREAAMPTAVWGSRT